MKKGWMLLLVLVAVLGFSGGAGAVLTVIGTATWDNLNHYDLIYDDVQSLVWLDYTRSRDIWQNQVNWAFGLNGSLRVTLDPGYTTAIDWSTGWRLPSAGPDPMTTSEMLHLHSVSLGKPSGGPLRDTTPFVNLLPGVYWEAEEYSPDPSKAHATDFGNGGEGYADKSSTVYATAVRPGEVSAVPVPKNGRWAGTTNQGYPVSFTVQNNQVTEFMIRFAPPGTISGYITVTYSGPENIVSGTFTYSSSRYNWQSHQYDDTSFSGTFINSTTCQGTYSSEDTYWGWSASVTWQAEFLTSAVATELVSNFGSAYGLYHYDKTKGWEQWNQVNPSQMVTADLNGDGKDELVVAFPGYGLYTYDLTNGWWQIYTLDNAIPENMIRLNNGIACDFGDAYGLWLWDQTLGWRQINTVDPDKMIAARFDWWEDEDDLIVSFVGYGLYAYNASGGWRQINAVVPDAMVRYRNGVVCDYGTAYGLWSYDTSGGWVLLNAVDPDKIVAVNIDADSQDELVVSFAGYGLYTYEVVGGIWQQINAVIPDAMIRLNNGIACDFGTTYGLWVWTQSGGWVQRNPVDPGQMTVVDLENDGVEELVVSFSGYGLYYFDETDGWQRLNDVVPEDIKSINFYP